MFTRRRVAAKKDDARAEARRRGDAEGSVSDHKRCRLPPGFGRLKLFFSAPPRLRAKKSSRLRVRNQPWHRAMCSRKVAKFQNWSVQRRGGRRGGGA